MLLCRCATVYACWRTFTDRLLKTHVPSLCPLRHMAKTSFLIVSQTFSWGSPASSSAGSVAHDSQDSNPQTRPIGYSKAMQCFRPMSVVCTNRTDWRDSSDTQMLQITTT